jgi:RNA recognition motif. (a.k.a. RRM, RBD, or RNP domain)
MQNVHSPRQGGNPAFRAAEESKPSNSAACLVSQPGSNFGYERHFQRLYVMDRLDMSLDDLVRESRKAKSASRATDGAVAGNDVQTGMETVEYSEHVSAPETAGPSLDGPSVSGSRGRDASRRGGAFPGRRHSRGGNRGGEAPRNGAPRRPIVVRDPRDGSTRIVGGGGATSNAPISRIINGYGGRRIVVRDPSAARRTDGQNLPDGTSNGVPQGVHGGYISKHGSSPRHRQSLRDNNVGVSEPEPKIIVHNLDPGVNDSDIHELFSNIGLLDEAFIVYDDSGRHTGTAEVTFTRMDDALSAIKRYNNVPLDNRPLRISLSGNLARSRQSRTFRGRGFARRGESSANQESDEHYHHSDPQRQR